MNYFNKFTYNLRLIKIAGNYNNTLSILAVRAVFLVRIQEILFQHLMKRFKICCNKILNKMFPEREQKLSYDQIIMVLTPIIKTI